jgi:hypothetical protein
MAAPCVLASAALIIRPATGGHSVRSSNIGAR